MIMGIRCAFYYFFISTISINSFAKNSVVYVAYVYQRDALSPPQVWCAHGTARKFRGVGEHIALFTLHSDTRP